MEDVLAAIYGFVVGRALPFVVLIGVLILVHELGHFTVAKLFRIRVERFSIGFGPRIFGWTWGETEYRVAWIPLGGYVKMKGDDPTQAEEAKEIPGSFLGAAVWKRILVVLAGPGVNLLLPIFVLALAAWLGHPVRTSYVGDVRRDTPAAAAGIEPGDRIVAINGVEITKWDQLTEQIGKSPEGEPVQVDILRGKNRLHLSMDTIQIEDTDLYGSKIKRPIIGISHSGSAPVGWVVAGSAAAQAGIHTGDEIVSVDGVPTQIWEEMEREVANHGPGALTVTIRRPKKQEWYQLDPPPGDEQDVTLTIPAVASAANESDSEVTTEDAAAEDPQADASATPEEPTGTELLARAGLLRGDTVVAQVADGSPAAAAGLHPGDQVVGVDDRPVSSGMELTQWLSELDLSKIEDPAPGTQLAAVTLEVERDGTRQQLQVTPQLAKAEGFFASRTPQPWVGFAFVGGSAVPGRWPYEPSTPDTIEERVAGIGPAFAAGLKGTGAGIYRFYELGKRLVQGRANVRDNIGGPIAIGYVAGMAVRGGLVAFLLTIAELSIILGVMNLLPIPVLDGGHLFFFGAEAVIGRPPSIRVREIAQQVGLALLLALMVFVMFNDVSRFF